VSSIYGHLGYNTDDTTQSAISSPRSCHVNKPSQLFSNLGSPTS
jgi:hypothetical protein